MGGYLSAPKQKGQQVNNQQDIVGAQAVPPARPRRRIFRWVYLGMHALFGIWLIAAIASAPQSAEDYCGQHAGPAVHAGLFDTAREATDACLTTYHMGSGIGVVAILVIWFLATVFVGLGYALWRLASNRTV